MFNPASPLFSGWAFNVTNASLCISRRPKIYPVSPLPILFCVKSIKKIHEIYSEWKEEEGISRVITTEEAVRNDHNLSPSRYVTDNGKEEVLPLDEAVVLLKEAEEERAEADEKLKGILGELGIEV